MVLRILGLRVMGRVLRITSTLLYRNMLVRIVRPRNCHFESRDVFFSTARGGAEGSTTLKHPKGPCAQIDILRP